MLTTQQCILTHLLNCGTNDLLMLDDINYDLDEILDDLVENNCLSFNDLYRAVFNKGIDDLAERLQEQRNDLIEKIKAEIRYDIESWVDSGDMTLAELKETEEYQQNIKDLTLIVNNELNPKEQYDYFLNYQDTHIFLKHLPFYRTWMDSDIDDIEDKMGISFKEMTYDD